MKLLAILLICSSFSTLAATDYQQVASSTTMLAMILGINLTFFFLLLMLSGFINKRRASALLAAHREAQLDPLTKLLNRRGFERAMAARKTVAGFLFIADVDNFKTINDSYGHDSGDDVLQEIADRLSSNLRDLDVISRFGGEEFVAFISGTSSDDAIRLGNRLVQCVVDSLFYLPIHQKTIPVTISIGAVPVNDINTDFETAFHLADKCLYSAKQQGKNQIVITT